MKRIFTFLILVLSLACLDASAQAEIKFEKETHDFGVFNESKPVVTSFIFENTGLMIGFIHKEKTSVSMASTLDTLQEILEDDYYSHFSLLLTDRGSEFEKHDLFENNNI